jgi:hypothetical protein
MVAADLEGACDVVIRVGVDESAGRNSVFVDSPKVDRARVNNAEAQDTGGRQRDEVLVADRRSDVDRRVDQRVRPFGQDRTPPLQIASRSVLLGGAVQVNVVVDDRRTSLDACQAVGRYFVGIPGHIGIGFLGGHAVDGCLDDHRVRCHVRGT